LPLSIGESEAAPYADHARKIQELRDPFSLAASPLFGKLLKIG
jgi:hypothetical protein